MVWNAPSWPLKGDNWKIQDDASVKVGTLCKKVSSRKDEMGKQERGSRRYEEKRSNTHILLYSSVMIPDGS